MNEDVSKRLEEIEFFILKKKKGGNSGHATLIDLCNDRVMKIESETRASFIDFNNRLEKLNSE
jgi:hypothetical protein